MAQLSSSLSVITKVINSGSLYEMEIITKLFHN
jgi:hypothetical protein